jgi:hypothetical protein
LVKDQDPELNCTVTKKTVTKSRYKKPLQKRPSVATCSDEMKEQLNFKNTGSRKHASI